MEARRDERKAKGERSRQAILRAALATLGDKGLEGFTARNVAERAGVSTATVFHHFATLDELQLEAVVLLFDDALGQGLMTPGQDLRGYLHSLGTVVLRMIRRQPELVRISNTLFGKLPFSEGLRRSAVQHYARYVAAVEGDLAALGADAAARRAHVALALVLLLDGLGIHWSIHHDVKKLQGFWSDMAELFADQLETPADATHPAPLHR
jgi:AcrR family transcriptional regulator